MLPITVDGTPEFEAGLRRLCRRGTDDLDAVTSVVRQILADVRRSGDEAVLRYVDVLERRTPAALVTRPFDGSAALARLPAATRASLEAAAERIRRYHVHQRDRGYAYEEDGVGLGLRVRPLARVGVYAPGGKARYPSSVLMSAIPARVAGVGEIVLATPGPDDAVLAAAHLAGVTTLLDAGGAHAIAAMAYGTASLPRVDKIVGPGNVYVACAKRLVFGEVAIDGIAGPSEVLVVADDSADPTLVAADLLSQAEHDEQAYALLVTTSRSIAEEAVRLAAEQLEDLPRRAIAGPALERGGLVFVVASRERMIAIANELAAEHVSLHVRDADAFFDELTAVGAAMVGETTPVAAADYFAGPSHVLPTGGCVRFGSPLGVYDFVSRSSMFRYSRAAL
jgi:histidinol dehydrogenase